MKLSSCDASPQYAHVAPQLAPHVASHMTIATQALSPAMDQWRKRISRIATNFEVAHKAELKTVEKRALDSTAKQPLQQVGICRFCLMMVMVLQG